jgi:hypothetical protein
MNDDEESKKSLSNCENDDDLIRTSFRREERLTLLK